MELPRMVVHVSCGAASAVAWKIATEHHGGGYTVVGIYCDTSDNEHPDNARFLDEVEKWVGAKVIRLRSKKYKTVEQVFDGERFISGPRGASCTRALKARPADAFREPGDIDVLGYTAEEVDRAARFEKAFPEIDTEWVLIDRGISKHDCLLALDAAGIKRPAMYDLGYHNNNCIGCVKGGKGYWNKIRRDFPDVFDARARQEREIGASILHRDGRSEWLDELDPAAGRHDTSVPECGVFCESRMVTVRNLITPTKETPDAN